MSTQEITLLDEFLTTLKELVEDINSRVYLWKSYSNYLCINNRIITTDF